MNWIEKIFLFDSFNQHFYVFSRLMFPCSYFLHWVAKRRICWDPKVKCEVFTTWNVCLHFWLRVPQLLLGSRRATPSKGSLTVHFFCRVFLFTTPLIIQIEDVSSVTKDTLKLNLTQINVNPFNGLYITNTWDTS